MKPTVGEVVHYKEPGTIATKYKPIDRAAIITDVKGAETVHLAVLNPEGMIFKLNVYQGDEDGGWNWTPAQQSRSMFSKTLIDGLAKS